MKMGGRGFGFRCVIPHVPYFFSFFFLISLIADGPIVTILPVVTKNLPISPRFTPYNFLSRCKFSTLTTRQPMVGFYLLTFPRFPLRKKEDKSYFGKNRTHDFRTSRCTGYLLDHSGDEDIHEPEMTTYKNASAGTTVEVADGTILPIDGFGTV